MLIFAEQHRCVRNGGMPVLMRISGAIWILQIDPYLKNSVSAVPVLIALKITVLTTCISSSWHTASEKVGIDLILVIFSGNVHEIAIFMTVFYEIYPVIKMSLIEDLFHIVLFHGRTC